VGSSDHGRGDGRGDALPGRGASITGRWTSITGRGMTIAGRGTTATVRLHDVTVDADAALRAQVAALAGVPADAVRTGRLCPACGSSAHGRPWARVTGRAESTGGGNGNGAEGGAEIGVSLSRSGPHLLTAVRLGIVNGAGGAAGARGGIGADTGIGVDIEEIAAVDARWDPSLVLAPGEEHLARTAEGRARMWAGKEAVLKLLGTGLRTPMPEIALADFDVRQVAAPPGFVAAIALPAGRRAELRPAIALPAGSSG